MHSGHLTRRTALQLIAGQTLARSVAFAKPVKRQKKAPNVVFVLADDVGYGDLACLGNPYIKTPNIDSMHERSVRFTDFHVSPTCSPSRASLMTGKYCNSVGVWHTIMGPEHPAAGSSDAGRLLQVFGIPHRALWQVASRRQLSLPAAGSRF